MKKNFFKKLSFVLALAMIVSVLAPAAGAFAAKAPKLNASTKYLYLGVDGKDEFDFNISNKAKGWKYVWSSANKKVATVNKKNGITTATGAGTTKVSVVITDKKGEEVDELTATVTVRDNIKELTITNLPADGKVAVGVAHDFNRSYVTVANKTKGSKGVTRWSVTPSEGATINDSGVFTATKAGEYTITARAFQSKAKYTSWLADSTKYASYVTSNEATYKVTVAASMVSAKQVNLKKFDLTFDSAVTKEDITKDLVVYYVLGGTKVKERIKSVSMSADNKTATVEMNYDFTKGTTYVVEYPNMKSVEFVSATTKVEDVVDMAILTKTAQISKEQKLDIALYNKDGVNIANDELLGKVTVDKNDSNNYAYLVGRSLYMHKLGEVVKLTATYHTYNWKDGKEVGNATATAEVTCVEEVKDAAGTIFGWSVQSTVPTNFTTPKVQTFKGANTKLYVVLKGKDASGNDLYTANYTGYPNAAEGTLGWKYTSSNENVLLVDGSGMLWGVKPGTATIVVSYNGVQVGACEITVADARKAAMASLSSPSLILSKIVNETLETSFKVQDQFGDDYKTAGGAWNARAIIEENGTYNAATKPVVTYIPGTNTITVNAYGKNAGTYNYTVKIVDGNDSNVVVPLNFSVEVKDPGSNLDITSYRIEADQYSYDMKSGSTISDAEVQLAVYAYNSAGIKIDKLTVAQLEALGATVTVRKPNGSTTGSSIISVTDKIDLVTTKTVSGKTVVDNQSTGAWTITASNTNISGTPAKHNKPVVAAGFEVKNTQTKAVFAPKSSSVTDKYSTLDATTLAGVINECISFTAGDNSLTAETGYIGVSNTNYFISDKRVTLYKIKVYERIASSDNWIEHEVDLGGMIISIK